MEKVLKEEITQYLGAYIEKRQASVEEWVALRPILEVCDKETGYKVRGGALVEENDDQEADECYIKRYFGGGKGADLEIRKAWRGRGRQGSSRFGFRCRDQLASVCWDGDR